MTEIRNLGSDPERGLTPLFGSRSLWALVRIAFWFVGAAVVFGLLMLASLWFAIPFVLSLGVALACSIAVALRARVGWALVRSWTRRPS